MIHLAILNSIYNRRLLLLQVPNYVIGESTCTYYATPHHFVTELTQKNIRKYIRFDIKFAKREID